MNSRVQITYGLWLEPEAQILRAMESLRHAIFKTMPGRMRSELNFLALPPWLLLEGSGYEPLPARQPPFWARRHITDAPRIVRRDRSSGRFYSPAVELAPTGIFVSLPDLVRGHTIFAVPCAVRGGAVPDLRAWSFSPGLGEVGMNLRDLSVFPAEQALLPVGIVEDRSAGAFESRLHQILSRLPDFLESTIPPAQRRFRRCSVHAVELFSETGDGQSLSVRWDSMVQVDLVQNRKPAV